MPRGVNAAATISRRPEQLRPVPVDMITSTDMHKAAIGSKSHVPVVMITPTGMTITPQVAPAGTNTLRMKTAISNRVSRMFTAMPMFIRTGMRIAPAVMTMARNTANMTTGR